MNDRSRLWRLGNPAQCTIALTGTLMLLTVMRSMPACAENSPAAATNGEVASTIRRQLTLDTTNYHLWLRDASRRISPLLLHQPYRRIQTIAQSYNYVVVDGWENGDTVIRHYLLKKNAYRFQSGKPLNAYLFITANYQSQVSSSSMPGKIYVANVGLGAELNAPFSTVQSRLLAPKGTALDEILNCKDVRSAGRQWPLLKSVFVSYGPFSPISSPITWYGFRAEIVFTASATKKIGEKTISVFVESKLDRALQYSAGGVYDLPNSYTPSDTLGWVRVIGGDEWWLGTPAEVEANQHKYLNDVDGKR